MEEKKKRGWLWIIVGALVLIVPGCGFIVGFGAGWGARDYCGDLTAIVNPGPPATNESPDTTSLKMTAEQKRISDLQISIGLKRGRSLRDIKIAIMTGSQESNNRNLSYGHAGSLGVYQQRPSQGWGSAKQILNPVYAINKFYSVLETIKNRASMPLMEVAIAVQRPSRAAYMSKDNNFTMWESRADAILEGVKQDNPANESEVSTSNSADITCEAPENVEQNVTADSFPEGCPQGVKGNVLRTGSGARITVCRINGMVVNAKIATKWQYLVKLAKADGINLTGGGFRTAAQQISLRKAHCGSSHYAIYEAPSSACSPYTARPGKSNHETALAVDLNNAKSFSSRVYRWMKAHAPKLGIYARVPGEPWHWSLGGH